MTDPDLLDTALPIDRFRAHVLADPALQMRLSALYDLAAFIPAVIDAAGAAGIPLTADMVKAATRLDPLDLARFGDPPVTGVNIPGKDWLPIGILPSGGEFVVDWAHFAGSPLTAPFFEEALHQARALPLNRLIRYRTPLLKLAATVGEDTPVPDGFIFHLSRCGSTLVSQMLASDSRHVVVSEASPIDTVVQLVKSYRDVPLAERIALLRAIIGAFGGARTGDARHFVVKLDSWHTLALPIFRLAFPDTPWVFLYREPVEILVSHVRMAGIQTVPGALPHDPYGIANATEMPIDEFGARALGRIGEAVLDHISLGGGLLINYADLPGAVEESILPHFGIEPDARLRAAMLEAAGRDAKAPARSFVRDGEAKQRAADANIRALAAAHLDGNYRRLEALRLAADG